MKRRTFLKSSAAALAGIGFPALVPASALGRGGAAAPSDRVALGCIGLGGQGSWNLRTFLREPDVEVVALCDVDRGGSDYDMMSEIDGVRGGGLEPAFERVKRFRREQGRTVTDGGLFRTPDYREVLGLPGLDAVCVCTPDHWHGIISGAAVAAGKDVYCEKPLVNSIPEGRRLADAVRRHGRVLQTGSHERSNDSVRFACELVRNGYIGELREITAQMPNRDPHHLRLIRDPSPRLPMPVPEGLDWDFWLGPATWAPYTKDRCHFWWRFVLDTGGGEMTDRGAHILDLAQFINGADDAGPVRLSARGRTAGPGLYDAFVEYAFACEYANGVRLTGTSEGERGLRLAGTEGWIFIHIHGGRLEAHPASILRETVPVVGFHAGRSPGHHRNFLDCVKSRQKPVAHEEIGHRTATLCHLLNIAMRTGRALEWDPAGERITNDAEADSLRAKPLRHPWAG